MVLHAQRALIKTSDFRGKTRRTLRLQVDAAVQANGQTEAIIHNLSESGLLIETAADLAIGESVHVAIPGIGFRSAKVTWKNERFFGCKFEKEIPRAAISAVVLKAPFDVTASVPHEGPRALDQLEGSEKLPFQTRIWIIVGLALVSWVLVGAAASIVLSVIKTFGANLDVN